MAGSYIITSESVSEGHPDKVSDQVSDAIVDAALVLDPDCRMACETLVKTGMVILAGEYRVNSSGNSSGKNGGVIDFEGIARQVVCDIGYDNPAVGFDGNTCGVLNLMGAQSADIAMGVDPNVAVDKDMGAGDQGMMYGYASDETDVLMPAPITYAHRLVRQQAEVRKNGTLPWLRPDAKSQVSLRYENDQPARIEAVVLSTQHDDDVSDEEIHEGVMEHIIRPVLPAEWLGNDTLYHINPTGRFVIGGPVGDCGLTGRKIIVDTYGGVGRHGGGAFSGKDPSKVDRSAAYAARYVAKNLVAAGLARTCEVQLSYAIGVAEPTSVNVETFGTGKGDDARLSKLVREHFDLRPRGIIEMLELNQPRYRATAAYGHFGRDDIDVPWERTDKTDALRSA